MKSTLRPSKINRSVKNSGSACCQPSDCIGAARMTPTMRRILQPVRSVRKDLSNVSMVSLKQIPKNSYNSVSSVPFALPPHTPLVSLTVAGDIQIFTTFFVEY